jgi:phage RecT family recombinase
MTTEIQTQPTQPPQPRQPQAIVALDAHNYGLSHIAGHTATKGERLKLAILQQFRVNQRLLECDPSEILAAGYRIAALDLDLATGEVWLIAKGKKCEVWPGAQGYITLAYRSGLVALVTMGDVREGDDFNFTRSDPDNPIHHVQRSSAQPIIAQWAMVTLNNGKKIAEVLYADAFPGLLADAKARLKDGFGYSPWAKHERRMTALVPLRRALKRAPKSVLQLAPQWADKYALTDDGEVICQPRMGRDASEVVAETLVLTSDQCNQGDEVQP